MRYTRAAALILGFCAPVFASTISLSDTANDPTFATAAYTLKADNGKNITTQQFNDSLTNTSLSETADMPNLLEPNDGTFIIAPTGGGSVTSATYTLGYTFTVNPPKGTVIPVPNVTNKSQTDPVFSATNDNLVVTLLFKDSTGHTLDSVDVTSTSNLDLLPYLLGTAPGSSSVATNFDSTGIFLKTTIRADGVTFLADLSFYNAATTTKPDRNVEIDYNVNEKLNSNSTVTLQELDGVPEPGSFALLGLGLAALAGFGRKLRGA